LPETNLSQLHQFFPNNWTPNQVKSDLNLIWYNRLSFVKIDFYCS
jgi:hypothetical protein